MTVVDVHTHMLTLDWIELLRARGGERYEVKSLLGQGGMGAVFLAEDKTLERPVAIKVLPPEMSHNQHFVGRFERPPRRRPSTFVALQPASAAVASRSNEKNPGRHMLPLPCARCWRCEKLPPRPTTVYLRRPAHA